MTAGATPARFARFEVLGQLGKGAQGAVLKAREPETGRLVALKVLLRQDGRSERRFRQEAQVLARLTHPGIVRVLDAGVESGVPWLAMALVEGQSLTARIEKEGPLAPAAAARVVADLARALAHCHAQGIVHRDLKPDNVLFEAASGRPILVDFGLLQRDAQVWGELSIDARSRLSKTGELRGTPAFMAPEQVDSKRYGDVGPAADIYALGAVLFFLLTGQLVHDADSLMGVIAAILEGKRDDVRARRPDVPAPIAEACARALAQQPAARFPTAEAFADALDASLASPAPAPRSRAPMLLAGLAALALVAGMVVAGVTVLQRPTAPLRARLRVTSDAPAEVAIEAESTAERVLGQVAPDASLAVELPAGPATLSARRGGLSLERDIVLEPGKDLDLHLTLRVAALLDAGAGATITVREAPGGLVVLADVASPVTASLPLGRYDVRVKAPELLATSATIDVRPGEPVPAVPAPRPLARVLHRTVLAKAVRAYVVADVDGDRREDLIVTHDRLGKDEPRYRFEARLVALRGDDGRELWSYQGVFRHSAAAVVRTPEPAVLAVDQDADGRARMVRLGLADGKVLRTTVLEEETTQRTPATPVPLADGSERGGVAVYLEPEEHKQPGGEMIVGVSASGAVTWRITRASLGVPAHATVGITVDPFDVDGDGDASEFLWTAGPQACAIDPATPDAPRSWTIEPRGLRATTTLVVPAADGRAALVVWKLAPSGSGLCCVEPRGRERWRRQLPQAYQQPPVWVEVSGRPAIQMTTKPETDGAPSTVTLLDPRTGETLAEGRVPALWSPATCVHAADGRAFFACWSRDGALRLLDASLREVWSARVVCSDYWAYSTHADVDGDGDDEAVFVQQLANPGPGIVTVVDVGFPEAP